MRLVKALKGRLEALVPAVLSAVEGHLTRIAATPLEPVRGLGRTQLPATASGVDDRLYCFEAVGHLLASDSLRPEDQARMLGSLIVPLVAQVRANLPGCLPSPHVIPMQVAAHERKVQQALVAIAHASKGFPLSMMTDRPPLGTSLVLVCA